MDIMDIMEDPIIMDITVDLITMDIMNIITIMDIIIITGAFSRLGGDGDIEGPEEAAVDYWS